MPFVLIVAGVVLLVAAVRNTQQQLFYLLGGDFTGPNNFIYWFLSILIIGAIGYIPKLKPVSDGFLILVILVLFLSKGNPNAPGGGFFSRFQQQIGTTTGTTLKPGGSTTGTVYTPGGITLPGITVGGGAPGGPIGGSHAFDPTHFEAL